MTSVAQRAHGSLAWRRLRRNRVAVAGLIVIACLVATAALAPEIAPYSPNQLSLERAYAAPSWRHLLGTDEFGRDVLSRIIFGARIVIEVAVSATAVASLLGIALGLVSGFFSGQVDLLVSRLVDVLLAFPAFLLAIALVSALGPSLVNIIIVIAVSRMPRYSRLVRGAVLSVKQQTFVESAKAIGASPVRSMLRHVLPSCLGPILVYVSLTLGDSILTVSGLSFLGIGVQPPTADWGVMLTNGREYLLMAPWIAFFPGIAIFVTVMAFNLLGDGLRDALDTQDA